LDIEAGGSGVSPFLFRSTVPVATSVTKAARALVSNALAGTARTTASRADKQTFTNLITASPVQLVTA
jgi:hypothetical protein